MHDIDDIRRDNLRIIEAEAGSTTAAATLLGMSVAQFSNLRDGAKDSKTGKPRGMRKATARKIEAAAKKGVGWMDEDHVDSDQLKSTLTPQQRVLLSLFDGLTVNQQDALIRELEATKQQNDEVLTELPRRKVA